MSRHLLALRQATIGDASESIAAVLDQLAREDPVGAQWLRSLDWAELRRLAAERALAQAAKTLACPLQKQYANASQYGTESGDPPKGTCIGVLVGGDTGYGSSVQLGVAIDGQALSFFWNVASQEAASGTLERMRETVRQAFREQTRILMLELLSEDGEVQREQDAAGRTVLRATLVVGGGAR
ncbi:hypothetical protein HYV74_03505 [Candidatus Uhrbacteria bacterium]|nr:hypothetical protein [Candidatus Uhrbacteria bacterium]